MAAGTSTHPPRQESPLHSLDSQLSADQQEPPPITS